MSKVIGYCRVSTERQAGEGVSLDAQRAKIEGYCALYNLELVEVIVDAGCSAKNLNRPGIQRALDMVRRKEAVGIVVFKLDRLTRRLKDLDHLIENYFLKGCSLVSVTEQYDTGTANGRMVLNVMTSILQWQREEIGERTRWAMQYKKSKNESTGEAPFGWGVGPDGVHLEENHDEQRVICLINELRDGGLSIRKITARLNAEQVPARGRLWHKTSVERVLRRVA